MRYGRIMEKKNFVHIIHHEFKSLSEPTNLNNYLNFMQTLQVDSQLAQIKSSLPAPGQKNEATYINIGRMTGETRFAFPGSVGHDGVECGCTWVEEMNVEKGSACRCAEFSFLLSHFFT
jgi:hypothetical protein